MTSTQPDRRPSTSLLPSLLVGFSLGSLALGACDVAVQNPIPDPNPDPVQDAGIPDPVQDAGIGAPDNQYGVTPDLELLDLVADFVDQAPLEPLPTEIAFAGSISTEEVCTGAVGAMWRSFNELYGLFDLIAVGKPLSAFSKILVHNVCHAQGALTVVDVERITRTVIAEELDALNESTVDSVVDTANDLPEFFADNNYNSDYTLLRDLYSDVTTQEDIASGRGIGSVNALLLASSAKMLILERQLRLAKSYGTNYEFHYTLHTFQAGIVRSLSLLDELARQVDIETARYSMRVESSSDEFGRERYARISFPNGGVEYGTVYDCSGTRCGEAENRARTEGNEILTSRRREARNGMLEGVDDIRSQLNRLYDQTASLMRARSVATTAGYASIGGMNSGIPIDGRTIPSGNATELRTGQALTIALPHHEPVESIAVHGSIVGATALVVEGYWIHPNTMENVGPIWMQLISRDALAQIGWQHVDFRAFGTGDTFANRIVIRLQGTGSARVDEVAIYSSNHARGRETSQSGGTGRASGFGVDGYRSSGSYFETARQSQPSWQVELGSNREIGCVLVFPEPGEQPLGEYREVRVKDSSGNVIARQGYRISASTVSGAPYGIAFPRDSSGRPTRGSVVEIVRIAPGQGTVRAREVMVLSGFSERLWGPVLASTLLSDR